MIRIYLAFVFSILLCIESNCFLYDITNNIISNMNSIVHIIVELIFALYMEPYFV